MRGDERSLEETRATAKLLRSSKHPTAVRQPRIGQKACRTIRCPHTVKPSRARRLARLRQDRKRIGVRFGYPGQRQVFGAPALQGIVTKRCGALPGKGKRKFARRPYLRQQILK